MDYPAAAINDCTAGKKRAELAARIDCKGDG